MSSNLPESSPAPSMFTGTPDREPGPSVREWVISAVLFLATFVTTSFAGLFYVIGDVGFFRVLRLLFMEPSLILRGMPFSVPLIAILLAHELGHYAACRYYGMRCTPPFFMPAPISITGTLGAFIKIRSQFRNKRALFDVGVAGPLAGFILVLPTLWIGISFSKLVPKGAFAPGTIVFGEPLIFQLLGALAIGYSPEKHDMVANPIAMAAWVGLLATSLNLLPIWQLDGGHISYSILGRSLQKKASIAALVLLILVSFSGWPTPSYLLFAVLLLVFGIRMRFYHPPTLHDDDRLGPERTLIGLLAFLILIVSFTPVPVGLT